MLFKKFKEDKIRYILKKIFTPYILPFFTINNKISEFSNDNFIYHKHDFFSNNIEYLTFCEKVEYELINCEDCIRLQNDFSYVSLITTWSIGTGHGYAQLYDILINLSKNYPNYKNEKYKFLVYVYSQKGILDIIKYFIPETSIIFIDPNKVYEIDSFIYLEGNVSNLVDNIDYRFHDFLVPFFEEFFYSKFINNKPTHKKICILKHNKESLSISDNRSFNYKKVEEFCDNNNYYLINHNTMNFVDIIYLIQNCEEILLSWGTSFYNHYIYISDKCKIISNFVLKDSSYHIYEYKNFSEHYKTHLNKFKNASINYYIVDYNLENNPLLYYDKEHLRQLPYISLDNIETNTYDYYDYLKGLWISRLSITDSGEIVKESNHFFELSLMDNLVANVQQHNGEFIGYKNHLIYYRLYNNYKLLNSNKLENNTYKIINDRCVYLSNSFSSGNAGHDLFSILNVINKFLNDETIKFIIMEEHINTNNYKIIELFVKPDRIITIKSNTFYNLKKQIIFQEIPSHDPNIYKELIKNIRNKIIYFVENNENYKDYKNLRNKKVIIIKNSKHTIVSHTHYFGDTTILDNYLLENDWVIINPEKDDFYKFSYMLLNANIIITSFQGGISCANQCFFNLSAKIIACTCINNINYSKEMNDYFYEDIFCNGFYNKHINYYLTFPQNINKEQMKDLVKILEKIV